MESVVQSQLKGWNNPAVTAETASRTPLVIGAGLPRTGTSSTYQALNELGFGPVMHMSSNFQQPWRLEVWRKALLAKRHALPLGHLRLPAHHWQGPATLPDWPVFLRGFGATLDSPACEFVEDFMKAFPDAKVLLTVRDSDEAWWRSYISTIGTILENKNWYRQKVWLISSLYQQACLSQEIAEYWSLKYCTDQDNQRSGVIHSRHNAYIKSVVPADQLLVFNCKEGWKPLCDFLGVPVPDRPFPHVNDTAGINTLIKKLQLLGLALWAVTVTGGAAAAFVATRFVKRQGGVEKAMRAVIDGMKQLVGQ